VADVLIIDDDPKINGILSRIVHSMGHETEQALTLHDGLQSVRKNDFDVVFLDLTLPDGNGLRILPDILATPSSPEVIIVTGTGDQRGAEVAFKHGAWAYVQKPFLIEDVALPFTRALQYREEKRAGEKPKVLIRDGIIGYSPAILASFDAVAQAAVTDASVLITGETGTGKELFARAIHNNSRRTDGSFVVVDCTALPEHLVESTLFGHEKGAFTGANRSSIGLVRQADGGTLFLDEIGELPLSIQKSFLRVLQEHRFRPIGGQKEITSHFRLVAATNRDLDAMVEAGQFRHDLLFPFAFSSYTPAAAS
jgi:two-component system NtrC family response regulator